MTSCCILPLALFSLGATGVWIGKLGMLAQYKWLFLVYAGVSLTYGFWKVYRPAEVVCDNGAACAQPASKKFMKISLWSATFVVTASLVFPYITPYSLDY